jgi:hypothetical protein
MPVVSASRPASRAGRARPRLGQGRGTGLDVPGNSATSKSSRLIARYQSDSTVYELGDQFGIERRPVSNILQHHRAAVRLVFRLEF